MLKYWLKGADQCILTSFRIKMLAFAFVYTVLKKEAGLRLPISYCLLITQIDRGFFSRQIFYLKTTSFLSSLALSIPQRNSSEVLNIIKHFMTERKAKTCAKGKQWKWSKIRVSKSYMQWRTQKGEGGLHPPTHFSKIWYSRFVWYSCPYRSNKMHFWKKHDTYIENTIHISKTQYTYRKHNIHIENTIYISKTQYIYRKYNTFIENRIHIPFGKVNCTEVLNFVDGSIFDEKGAHLTLSTLILYLIWLC